MELKNVKVGVRVQVKNASRPATDNLTCAEYGLHTGQFGTILDSELSPFGSVKVQFDDHDGREHGASFQYLYIKAHNLRKVK